MTDQLLSTHI